MTLIEQFVDRLIEFRARPLSDAEVSAARTALIDTMAVTLLGSTADCARIARNTAGIGDASGAALVYGTAQRTSALDAAMLNGIASHADDYDDFTDIFGGHPSVPVFPAVLALAETLGCDGRSLLAAYVAGVELENRIALGVHFHHYEKGWHPTSTLGVFGAAGAAAHLLDLSREQSVNAIALAASFASGLKANFGSMAKPLHVGHCTRSGLQAALLASGGFTARADVFEQKQGFLNVYNGAGHYDTQSMLGSWFSPPLVLNPGLSIKQFACCGSTHPSIYMALKLREQGPIAQALVNDGIERIDVRVSPKRLPHTNNPDPRSSLQAKFSVQYAVARTLHSGAPRLADFDESAYAQPEVRSLMGRLAVASDPQLGEGVSDNAFGSTVRVVLKDGRQFEERTEHLPGRGREYPMTTPELREKFFDCAAKVLSAERAGQLIDKLERIDEVKDFREVTADMARAVAAA
ncbi:MAG: MmgE/PrpD family protein [Gammaproteobacteria bacterium]|nr:MmgE/PrpD family protein [Gammaproteobacteria bacterium]